jgi:hypothetical protein
MYIVHNSKVMPPFWPPSTSSLDPRTSADQRPDGRNKANCVNENHAPTLRNLDRGTKPLTAIRRQPNSLRRGHRLYPARVYEAHAVCRCRITESAP